MKTIYLKEIDSTQKYLLKLLETESIKPPIMVYSFNQVAGIGSRNNSWQGLKENLFFSFAIKKDELPDDLKIESSSIYFSYLLKEILKNKGSKVFIKWPNDFYINNQKIGGVVTSYKKNILICGIGLNTDKKPENFGVLDIKIDKKELLQEYIKVLKKRILWKEIFIKFSVEFQNQKDFSFNLNGKKIFFKDTKLNSDGSISYLGKKIFSLR